MIMPWERTKGCFNEKCKAKQKKKKFKESFNNCPLCGSELTYVCKHGTCYKPLSKEDGKVCKGCIPDIKDKREKKKNNVLDGIVVILTAAAGLFAVNKHIKK